MQLRSKLIFIVCIFSWLSLIESFWLTDSTLFQPATSVQVGALDNESGRILAKPSDNAEVFSKTDWLRLEPPKQQVSLYQPFVSPLESCTNNTNQARYPVHKESPFALAAFQQADSCRTSRSSNPSLLGFTSLRLT